VAYSYICYEVTASGVFINLKRGSPGVHLRGAGHFGHKTLRHRDTSAPQNWCQSLRRIAGGAVSHRNCPGSKCSGFSSITALVSKCLEIGAKVSQSVLIPKCLVAEVPGNPFQVYIFKCSNFSINIKNYYNFFTSNGGSVAVCRSQAVHVREMQQVFSDADQQTTSRAYTRRLQTGLLVVR